ncbi:MAG: helix-turn-helix transcriptional regulator [Actinophytocola sp.]|uniref:helix-turn-helix domain-containing protein n=1 Tax=Actinophytocola sp. TaxID=1872138 RepID=UPI003C71CAE7
MTTADEGDNNPGTEADLGPFVQRILLGARLRAARESIGLSSTDATKTLGWYAGKLSKIEQGDVPTSDKDLAAAIRAFKIGPKEAGELQRLASLARRKLPPSRVAEWAAKYVHLVAAARELKLWNADAFPGTVQTADYARAQLERVVTVRPADVEPMAQDRAKRVERLRAPGAPRLWLVVGEEALHRSIGGPETLRGQLEQVRDLAELENVSVQVMPFSAGAHASHGVSFSIVNLMEGRPGLVYVAGLTTSDYLGREHQRVYDLVFDKLRADALSPQGTIELINRRIAEL